MNPEIQKTIEISLEDVEISNNDIEGWLVASDNGITVALDTTLSPELINEGIARELVSKIQNLRKDNGFDVTDRINIYVNVGNSNKEYEAILNKKDYICSETLSNDIIFDEKLDDNFEIDFLEGCLRIKVEKIF